eukprot:m.37854 g.37854  ORF g.37854 m.37854 type:complete len:570 (-) comp45130_c0_seq7:1413-3122(-)
MSGRGQPLVLPQPEPPAPDFKALRASIEMFDGFGCSDVRAWLRRFVALCAAQRVANRSSVIPAFLTPRVLDHMMLVHPRFLEQPWADLEKWIIDTYARVEDPQENMRLFTQCRQKAKQSVREYAADFTELAVRAKILDLDTCGSLFVSGLHRKLVEALGVSRMANFAECVQNACFVESRLETCRGVDLESASASFVAPVRAPKLGGYAKAQKPQAPKAAKQAQSEAPQASVKSAKGTCHYCRKPGHFIAECRKRLAKQAGASASAVSPTRFVMGTFNGRPMRLTVDTASQLTLVKSSVTVAGDGPRASSTVRLHGADRTAIKTSGKLRVCIGIGSSETDLDVVLVDDLAHDVLLGTDFCELVGATIDYGRNTFSFGLVAENLCSSVEALATASNPFFVPHVGDPDPEDIGAVPAKQIELSSAERSALDSCLMENAEAFQVVPGNPALVEPMPIELVGSATPHKSRPYRLSLPEKAFVTEKVNEMLEQGVIRKSFSPWASPVVLVHKKGGTYRFCVNYQRLNDVTVSDSYPLPRIDEILDSLSGSQYFSTLDLAAAYHQVPLAASDVAKT